MMTRRRAFAVAGAATLLAAVLGLQPYGNPLESLNAGVNIRGTDCGVELYGSPGWFCTSDDQTTGW